MIDQLLVIVALGYTLLVITVLVATRTRRQVHVLAFRRLGRKDRLATRRHRRGWCRACGYDMAGLSGGSRCPECGEADPLRAPAGMRECLVVDRLVLARTLVVMFTTCAAVLAFAQIVGLAHAWSYRLKGFHSDVVTRAMRYRGVDLTDLPWASCPLLWLILLSPLVALISPWRRFRHALFIAVGGGFLLSVAWLFGAVWLVYGR